MVRNNTSSWQQQGGRLEWPASSQSFQAQRGVVRRKKDPKVAYYTSTKYSNTLQRNIPALTTPASLAPEAQSSISRPHVEIHQLASPIQNQMVIDYQVSPTGHGGFEPPPPQFVHQGDQAEDSWPESMANLVSHTLPMHPPNPPQSMRTGSISPTHGVSAPLFGNNNEMQFSYQTATATPTPGNYIPEVDDLSASSRFGSFDSFDSMGMSGAHTVASSVSEGYVCPNPNFGSSGSANLRDLALPDQYFSNRCIVDQSPVSATNSTSPIYPEDYPVDGDYCMPDWDYYPPSLNQYITGPLTHESLQEQQQYNEISPSSLSENPWNYRYLQQENNFAANADAGIVAFEPSPGAPFEVYNTGEQFLESAQHDSKSMITDPLSPSGTEEWLVVPSHASSSVPAHESPRSAGSPWSHVSSPVPKSESPPPSAEIHSHVFSAYAGVAGPKLPRGRQRALTVQEKREALDVRKAKACWACHLSKIKCSPCSPGQPCHQCDRLAGKRRFCWLPCFNDPLETLLPFVAPEYLFADYTQAKVEWFVSQNATGWGTHEINVRMFWGYPRLLEARVVSVNLRENSELGYFYQVLDTNTDHPRHVQRKSPPVGLPLASIEDMKIQYSSLLREIIQNQPEDYLSTAYDDQDDGCLPDRLLLAVTNFYTAGLGAGDECVPLREALEIHVASSILDRSLAFDDRSIQDINNHLGERYPPNSASRCAQRQIKLAFFEIQKTRIAGVLEAWGNMMWTSNKHTPIEMKWARSFSILVILTLVIDQNLNSAYWTCESRIAKRSAEFDVDKERKKFNNLVRITQTELFERCKEIFHSSFKTRKGGKEACNPIRDGIRVFRGKAVNEGITRFVWDLAAIMRDLGPSIRSHRIMDVEEAAEDTLYTDAGRLASIFLADFLDH